MRFSVAIAAAALLGFSAQSASQSPYSSSPLFPMSRLRGGTVPYPSFHLLFQGNFNNAAGKAYDLMGDGTIVPADLGGGTPGYRYKVTLRAFARDSASPKIDFGTLEGQGPINGPSTPDHFNFNIRGIPNPNGYRLDLNGFFQDGLLAGDFKVAGGGGVGQGDFAGGK